MSFNDWMQLLAGTGLFMFAMLTLEDAIRLLAGRPFKIFLQKQTSGIFKGITGGTIVTAILQSSSLVSVMVLSFVGAGIINMRNALPVILGANLGTTLSNWIVALVGFKVDLEAFSYPIIGVAFIGLAFFQKKEKIFQLSRFLMAFALVFIGLDFMKQAAETFVKSFDVEQLRQYGVFIFIIAGFLLTALIQSSTATVALTLASLNAGILVFPQAAGIVIGAELGTTLKLVLGSVGGIPDKKRISAGNFIFNIIIIIEAVILLKPLTWLIFEVIKPSDNLIGLVMFQTAINLVGIILILPFINWFSLMLEKMFRDDKHALAEHLSAKNIHFPEDFISALEKEVEQFIVEVLVYNEKLFEEEESPLIAKSKLLKGGKTKLSPDEHYEALKTLEGDIIQKVAGFSTKEFTPEEMEHVDELTHSLRRAMFGAKEVKDVRQNLADLKDTANNFSHAFYEKLKKDQEESYDLMNKYLHNRKSGEKKLHDMYHGNRTDYEARTEKIFEASGKNKLERLEASTLLNVIRAVYASSKELIKAIASYHKISLE